MLSRAYNKRISIYRLSSVNDGFGGNTVSKTLLGESWAKIETASVRRLTELGQTELSNTLIFKVRYREDLTYSIDQIISYRDKEYTISSIINKGFHNTEIEIIANGKE